MSVRGTIGFMADQPRPHVKLRFDVQRLLAQCSLCQRHDALTVVRVSLADRESNYHLICSGCVQGMAEALKGATS